ncbi:MAG: adenylosuccinate synthase [Candidatus Krumholzibacteriota bacterium]|nr:adenylosuccinate synthase [Candidatus Krumholzibacteriota bacterium]
MPATIVLGGQWGDEGKAKVVDFLMPHHDIVMRFQGGANAGHTVVTQEGKFAFHQIPSGVLYPGVIAVMGNGMVVDPEEFLKELGELMSRGIDFEGRLFISSAAQVVMPYHKLLDTLYESDLKNNCIGSTRKGIGPAYSDKYTRQGIRIGDFLLPKEEFFDLVSRKVENVNRVIEMLGAPALSPAKIASDLINIRELIDLMVIDTQEKIHQWKSEGKRIMLEGAQGTLLDIDHGTYPFVTSSSCSVGGAMTGSGLAPRDIGRVIGIFKAYTTRVGNGPFPTELDDDDGKYLAEKGNEFGTTTGRPRRCGWLDLVAAKYSVQLNGLSEIALTKLDVLSGLKKVKVCVAYEIDGKKIDHFPQNTAILSKCKPVFEEMDGWDDTGAENEEYVSLPGKAREYVEMIEKRLAVKASFISHGPERKKTIIRDGF